MDLFHLKKKNMHILVSKNYLCRREGSVRTRQQLGDLTKNSHVRICMRLCTLLCQSRLVALGWNVRPLRPLPDGRCRSLCDLLQVRSYSSCVRRWGVCAGVQGVLWVAG